MPGSTFAHSRTAALWEVGDRREAQLASIQAQLGIKALPGPEKLPSLQVTANEVFVPKICTGGKKNPLA